MLFLAVGFALINFAAVLRESHVIRGEVNDKDLRALFRQHHTCVCKMCVERPFNGDTDELKKQFLEVVYPVNVTKSIIPAERRDEFLQKGLKCSHEAMNREVN